MPTRFIAMKGVNAATDGLGHKVAHSLIKSTLASFGENIMKYKWAYGMTRAQLLECISAIIDEQALDNPKNRLASNVSITNALCANIKRIHRLQYATHLTLGTLYRYVRRTNRWFEDHRMSAEYQLVQASDLANVLGYKRTGRIPLVAKFNPIDIRLHFATRV